MLVRALSLSFTYIQIDKVVHPSHAMGDISERLFQSPSPKQRTIGDIMASLSQNAASSGLGQHLHDNTQHSSGKGKDIETPTRVGGQRTPGGFIPKGIRLKFRPTLDMNLSGDELKVAVYTYFMDHHPMEVLLKRCAVSTSKADFEISATRADFETLCPGRYVSPKVSIYLFTSLGTMD